VKKPQAAKPKVHKIWKIISYKKLKIILQKKRNVVIYYREKTKAPWLGRGAFVLASSNFHLRGN
jgi:hypothetical protein